MGVKNTELSITESFSDLVQNVTFRKQRAPENNFVLGPRKTGGRWSCGDPFPETTASNTEVAYLPTEWGVGGKYATRTRVHIPSHSWFFMLLLFMRLCLFFTLGVSTLSSPLFTDNEVFDMPMIDSSPLLWTK